MSRPCLTGGERRTRCDDGGHVRWSMPGYPIAGAPAVGASLLQQPVRYQHLVRGPERVEAMRNTRISRSHATASLLSARGRNAGIRQRSTRRNCTWSTMPVTRTRAPFSSILMPDAADTLSRCGSTCCRASDAGSEVSPVGAAGSATGSITAVLCATPSNRSARSCRRHLNTILGFSPCACASLATEIPGSHAATATCRRYSGV